MAEPETKTLALASEVVLPVAPCAVGDVAVVLGPHITRLRSPQKTHVIVEAVIELPATDSTPRTIRVDVRYYGTRLTFFSDEQSDGVFVYECEDAPDGVTRTLHNPSVLGVWPWV